MASKQQQFKAVTTKSATTSPAHLPKQQTQTSADEPQIVTMDLLQQALKEALKVQSSELLSVLREDIKKVDDDLAKLKDVMETKNNEIRGDILYAFEGLAGHVERIDEIVENLEQSRGSLEKKVDEVKEVSDRIDKEVLIMQYRQMEQAIRVRGLKESKQENLQEIFVEAFSKMMDMQKADLDWQIEKIYRVNSRVARQRQLARDVVVYFASKRLRNEILQASFKEKLQVEGQEVLILKEIPPKILRARKDYAFLVEELKNCGIQFP